MASDRTQREGNSGIRRSILHFSTPIALSVALLAVPFVHVWRFGFDAPLVDEWDVFGNLLTAIDSHELSFNFLFSPHNEHRITTLRLLLLALLPLTKWNVFPMYFLNIGTAVCTVALIWGIYLRSCGSIGKAANYWVLAAISMFAFAPSQMESWLLGQLWQYFACNLFAVLAIALLLLDRNKLRGAGLGALAGLAATLSSGNGMLFWPVAAVSAFVSNKSSRRWIWVGAWTAASIFVFALYFHGLARPASHPSLFAGFHDPAGLVEFVLAYVGHPVGAAIRPQSPAAPFLQPILGAVFFALLALVFLQIHARKLSWNPFIPWLALLLFFLTTEASIAFARVGFGASAALSSRYITLSYPLWACLVAMGDLATSGYDDTSDRFRPRIAYLSILTVLVAVGLLSLNSYAQRWRPIADDRKAGAAELPDVCEGNLDLIQHLYPVPGRIYELLPLFQRYEISFTKEIPISEFAFVSGSTSVGQVESPRLEPPFRPDALPCLNVSGTLSGDSAGVVMVSDNHILKKAMPKNAERGDSKSWSMHVSLKRLPSKSRFQMYAISSDGKSLLAFPGGSWIVP